MIETMQRCLPSALGLKPRLILLYAFLAMANGAAWIWAMVSFHGQTALLGIALLVYGLGIRHAVDADHIAAIDNVTRKLRQENKRPLTVGVFFAMGHSAVVAIVVILVASATTSLSAIRLLGGIGGAISTGISAVFLLAVAAMNVAVFLSVYATYRQVRAGGSYQEDDLAVLLNSRGPMTRLLRPLFGLVTQSWHMIALGFLFGLGFDTATEIALFGTAAAQSAKGASFEVVLVLPALFAAGMSLVDATDGVVMLGVYEWAFVKPARKLCYNMMITLVSVVVALLVAGIEALHLIDDRLLFSGWLRTATAAIGDNFDRAGLFIVGVFLMAWIASYLVYRVGRTGEFEG